MPRQRIYSTEEDLRKRNRKHYLKYRRYFKIYGKHRYLMKKVQDLENSPKDKTEKFDEMLAMIKKDIRKSTKRLK